MEPVEHPAKKIKFLMRSYNTAIQALAEKVGIPLESLRDILDEREMPTPNLLYRMCQYFGVNENFFGEGLRPVARPKVPDSEREPGGGPLSSTQLHPPGDPRRRRLSKFRGDRKLDLAELAARQQVLFELLISKNVFTKDEFETRMEILRAHILARKQQSGQRTR